MVAPRPRPTTPRLPPESRFCGNSDLHPRPTTPRPVWRAALVYERYLGYQLVGIVSLPRSLPICQCLISSLSRHSHDRQNCKYYHSAIIVFFRQQRLYSRCRYSVRRVWLTISDLHRIYSNCTIYTDYIFLKKKVKRILIASDVQVQQILPVFYDFKAILFREVLRFFYWTLSRHFMLT